MIIIIQRWKQATSSEPSKNQCWSWRGRRDQHLLRKDLMKGREYWSVIKYYYDVVANIPRLWILICSKILSWCCSKYPEKSPDGSWEAGGEKWFWHELPRDQPVEYQPSEDANNIKMNALCQSLQVAFAADVPRTKPTFLLRFFAWVTLGPDMRSVRITCIMSFAIYSNDQQ